jgi:hypothetical protein
VKSEKEIRNQLKILKQQRLAKTPYTERKNIAWHGSKQALEWVLEETETPLTY